MYLYVLIVISIVFLSLKVKVFLLQINILPSALKSSFRLIWNKDNVDRFNTTYTIYSSHCVCIHSRHTTFILLERFNFFPGYGKQSSWPRSWVLPEILLLLCLCLKFPPLFPWQMNFCSSALDSEKKSILVSFRKAESITSSSSFPWHIHHLVYIWCLLCLPYYPHVGIFWRQGTWLIHPIVRAALRLTSTPVGVQYVYWMYKL